MVFLADHPNTLAAACCKVEVLNGGWGDAFLSDFLTFKTIYSERSNSVSIFLAVSPSWISAFFVLNPRPSVGVPFILASSISNFSPFFVSTKTVICQYSSALNFSISLSRSTIRRTATLCTRPADKPRRTFFHNIGDSL